MEVDLGELLSAWVFEPVVVVGLALAVVLYALGWRRLRRRTRGKTVVGGWRVWCYGMGLVLVALALLSPVAALDDELLLMHMLQHMLLISAAPLLLLGAPLLPLLWVLPLGLRRVVALPFAPGRPVQTLFGALTHPAVAVAIYVVVLGVWHAPVLYDAAQGETILHELEHTVFLAASLLYWWPIVHPFGGRRRLGYGTGILYLGPSILEQNAIGMVLTFIKQPVYAAYVDVPRLWGISVVLDQNLAGAAMGVISTVVDAITMTVLVVLFLKREERQATRQEQAVAERESSATGLKAGS